MTTILLQSFRTHEVPAWLARCMQSVREWAALRGYEYRFMGDEFFDILPASYVRTDKAMTVSADYARALWAERLLAQGTPRFVWVDADVLVFAPGALDVETIGSFGFCHEVLPVPGAGGGLEVHHRINNAISVYGAGNPFLGFYLHAMAQLLARRATLAHDALGTMLLSGLGGLMPMPVLFNVGLFSPLVLQSIVRDEPPVLAALLNAGRAPLAAANFCQSLSGRELMGVTVTDALFDAAVARCLATRGDCVNRYRSA